MLQRRLATFYLQQPMGDAFLKSYFTKESDPEWVAFRFFLQEKLEGKIKMALNGRAFEFEVKKEGSYREFCWNRQGAGDDS